MNAARRRQTIFSNIAHVTGIPLSDKEHKKMKSENVCRILDQNTFYNIIWVPKFKIVSQILQTKNKYVHRVYKIINRSLKKYLDCIVRTLLVATSIIIQLYQYWKNDHDQTNDTKPPSINIIRFNWFI